MIIIEFYSLYDLVNAILRHGSLFDDTIRVQEIVANDCRYIAMVSAMGGPRSPLIWRCQVTRTAPIGLLDNDWLKRQRAAIASEWKRLDDAGIKYELQPGVYSEQSGWPYGK